MLTKVISGGQTGVDRAALDAAIACGIPVGGYCPKGRRAEDGRIPDKYPLVETLSSGYQERTRRNILESDATLVFTGDTMTPGTALTIDTVEKSNKDFFTVYFRAIHDDLAANNLISWLDGIKTLNVAGPRESKQPGIYKNVYEFLVKVFAKMSETS